MEKIDSTIKDLVTNGVIPGMTYSIINNGEIDYGCEGYKSLIPSKENVTIDTIYDIASLTKVIVTVTLISKMIDKGLISLSDKANKYNKDIKYDDITIYHLLTHTSGLPADIDSKEIMSPQEIKKLIYSLDKKYETGKQFLYSDIGYIMLGDIISNIYNKPLDLIANEEIFIPLNMTDTSYNPLQIDRCAPTELTKDRGLVKGNVHDEKAYSLNGVAGHAGVFSTAKDLSNFAQMVLNNGIYNNARFLSSNLIDEWFKPLVLDDDEYRSYSYIYGSNSLVIKEGENVISFNGFTGPSISIDRDNNIGIVLMTNRVHPTRDNRQISKARANISHEVYKQLVMKR